MVIATKQVVIEASEGGMVAARIRDKRQGK